MKYCTNCGTEIPNGTRFCTKCGQSTNQDSSSASKKHETNKKAVYIALTVLAIIVTILIGTFAYSKFQESRELQEALQKKESVIPMRVVLEMYKKENRQFAIEKLKEYGYQYYKDIDDNQYWQKNAQIKEVENWRGDIIIESTKKIGSLASFYGKDGFYFGIKVYSQKDFDEWVKQLNELGYKEDSYGEECIMEEGWTILGAHGNKCKIFKDSKGNTLEFMKDGDGNQGYCVYIVEFNK